MAGLKKWQQISDSSAKNNFLVYAGSEAFTQTGIKILPWNNLKDLC